MIFYEPVQSAEEESAEEVLLNLIPIQDMIGRARQRIFLKKCITTLRDGNLVSSLRTFPHSPETPTAQAFSGPLLYILSVFI